MKKKKNFQKKEGKTKIFKIFPSSEQREEAPREKEKPYCNDRAFGYGFSFSRTAI